MRIEKVLVAMVVSGLVMSACGGEDTTAGPSQIKNVENDAGEQDGSLPSDGEAPEAGGDVGAEVAAPADTSPGVCVQDWECSGLDVPLCNAPKCLEGKCAPLPTAEGVICDDGNPCTTGDVCKGGLCGGVVKACDDGDPCTDDACEAATGACGHVPLAEGATQACDDGDKCTGADKCIGGKCVGEPSGCDDGNPCTDDTCDADGACVYKHNTQPCGGGSCEKAGQCKAGKCIAGGAVVCDDSNPCTDDKCDTNTGLCVFAPTVGLPCDDGDKCTGGEACDDGKCKGGQKKVCNGGTVCSPQVCNAATGLCAVSPKTGGACDDGDKCTTSDTCQDGTCAGGAPPDCQDANPCTDDKCDAVKGCTHTPNTAACSDDKQCVIGVCKGGKCAPGSAKGCDDNNPCTQDVCTKAKGCVYTPASDGTGCGEKNACQEAAFCKAGKCVGGAKADCDDGNACTDDLCKPELGCMWEANEAPCDDGDACTQADKCTNGKCKGGEAVDPTKACDDKNPCTKDACDPKAGCVHGTLLGPCDDGDICTAVESCVAGKCVASKPKCEETGPCTTAACAPGTGKCSWISKTGPCDDGDACTAGDHCAKGKCVPAGPASCDDKSPCTTDSCEKGKCQHTPVSGSQKCDDGDKCTQADVCVGGQCKGKGGPVCDDGNACTSDGCNPLSGKCTFKPSTGPCDNNDPCTFGDKCSNGKCVTGKSQICDDGSPCTADTCDPKTGKCAFKPAKDGSACDDGKACSTGDACKAGKCVPASTVKCALWVDTFECAAKGAGWKLDKPSGKKVLWLVDKTPIVGGEGKWGCSLNFNNGVNYCDKAGKSCQKPTGYATSPLIDGTKLKGPGRLRFRTYIDLDAGYSDRPYVSVRGEKNKQLWGKYLQKTGNEKKWIDILLDVPAMKGHKFRILFGIGSPSGWGGNKGKGWFIDNLRVEAKPPVELCADGVDNDGNGLKDCFDPACKGKPGCVEDCGDGVDNDKDDKVDCKDSDCKGKAECQALLLSHDFKCGSGGWTFADLKRNGVAFAIDAKPSTPKALLGGCTLNFNNGKNFCGVKDCGTSGWGNATAGTATRVGFVDGGGYKKLWAVYWSWIDAEPNGGNATYYDRGWLQASVDGYKGCCGATYACSKSKLNTCNTQGTSTWMAPRYASDQKKWRKVVLDLSKFAGKKFSLRFRFNSGDGKSNGTSGWFIDKLRIYGAK